MILVAGATGHLGGMIANRLLDAGEEIAILVREGSDHSQLASRGARPRFGDLRDPESLARACAGARVVISTANSAGRGGDDNVKTVEIEGNQNLIDAAENAGVKQFVFISALGADVVSQVPFLRGKALAEQHLRQSGMNHTIIQPNFFIEVWAGMLVAGPLLAGAPVTVVGDGNQRHSMISIRDVAAFATAAINHREAKNRTLVVGGPEPLSWREVAARFEKVTGRSVQLRTIAIGEKLPGFPDVVSNLAASMAAYESPIPMHEVARTFGVVMTPIDAVIREMMPPVEASPLPVR